MDDETVKDDNQAGSSAGPMLFKKRNKVRGTLASTSSGVGLSRKPISQDNDDDEDDDIGSSSGHSVFRSAGLKGRRSNLSSMGTSAGTRNNGKSLKLQSAEEDASNTASTTTRKSGLAQSVTLPASLIQASIGDDGQADSVYSPASLAALKAGTPNRRKIIDENNEEDGHLQAAHEIMHDSNAGENMVRQKYRADFAHEGIPSEAVINAAKEKRRRAMEATSTSEDFISINDDGPHPGSRIVREDDEVGSGEEEFAEFTGATERIALDEEGMKREKAIERERRKEEIEQDNDEEMSDDSGKEWEEAQMQREMASSSSRRSKEHRRDREISPYKPAPIPQSATLPTLTSTSARLQEKIAGLQLEMQNQDALQNHTNAQLAQLKSDEERNKDDTETAAEREAWFREFEQFIVSMAEFLEEKVPKLEDVETDWIGHLVLRTKMIQQARADALTDQISLFYGVPSTSLLPKQDQDGEDAPRPPIENGDALSAVRQARRAYAESALGDELSSADQASFQIAQHEIVRRANGLLDDVQAAEYREPAARTMKSDEHGQQHSVLHPASLVVRFHRWRQTYPKDYSNAWGGLTLASIWDFWLRKSLCGWDMMRLKDQRENSFDQFKWYKELLHYTHKAQHKDAKHGQDDEKMDEDEEESTSLGGDDEIISHAFTNTVIPVLVRIVDKGAFDPWNRIHNTSAIELMEQMSYVMEKDNVRFQSLISSFLRQFQYSINALVDALTLTPVSQAPAMAPDAPNALFQCVQFISITITQNLIGWHRFVLASQRPFLQELTNELTGKVIIPLLDMAKHIVGGKEMVQQIAQDLLRRTARPALLNENNCAELGRMQTL